MWIKREGGKKSVSEPLTVCVLSRAEIRETKFYSQVIKRLPSGGVTQKSVTLCISVRVFFFANFKLTFQSFDKLQLQYAGVSSQWCEAQKPQLL